ncbi:PqqD family protein [Janibacter limosus]|jgi:hypothetical protein|uniref:PqqD family protein n=2 Tax=Janibacter limosus TaxID=53458 RepID=A0AC61U2H0_9MICO|nr:PqqD family protein [Janibacter limosus]QBF45274.1 PqqD family protein [Janibacter limosus]UUZ44058.1 PqqD family protein [Janibacter limosus]
MTRATPPYAVPPGVGWTYGEADDGADLVYVAHLPNGPISVLPGIAALIWRAAVEGSMPVVDTVSATTGHPATTVREDVESFVADLIRQRLIEPT